MRRWRSSFKTVDLPRRFDEVGAEVAGTFESAQLVLDIPYAPVHGFQFLETFGDAERGFLERADRPLADLPEAFEFGVHVRELPAVADPGPFQSQDRDAVDEFAGGNRDFDIHAPKIRGERTR